MDRETKVTQAALDRQAAYNNHIKLAKGLRIELETLLKRYKNCIGGNVWDETKEINQTMNAIHAVYERTIL